MYVGEKCRRKQYAVSEIVQTVTDQNHGSGRFELRSTFEHGVTVMPQGNLLEKKEREYASECGRQDRRKLERLHGLGK